MKLCVEIIATTLLTAVLVASTPVPDNDDGQSVTVGASWLQRRSNDAVKEVVHLLDDYDEPTTFSTTTPPSHRTLNGQLSSQTTGQISHTPTIGDNIDFTEQTEPTEIQATTRVTTSTTNTPAASNRTSHRPQVTPVISASTTESAGNASSSRHVHSGTDRVFTYRAMSNSSTMKWRPPTDVDEYYYTDQSETADNDVGFLTKNNETDEVGGNNVTDMEEKAENETTLLQQLFETDETVVNISGREEMDNSSFTEITDDSFVADRSQSELPESIQHTTSTASPLSTAWLLAELPAGSEESDWTNEVHSAGDYVPAHRESPPAAAHVMISPSAFSARFGPHWRLFRRLARPTRRRGYRQMLASPFVAGGGATTDRERKRALLQAYLLSGVAGKDRRAMSAAVFYRSKLAKPPPALQQELGGGPPKQTYDAEPSSWISPTVQDVTASPQGSNGADVTTGWTNSLDNNSLAWTSNGSVSMNNSTASWASADDATSNVTYDEGQVAAKLYHTSPDRAAAAAVVIPIIVGFLESLTRKQFSWLDLTLAVCGTVAVLLGLINLVVFVVHLVRTKRGKLSFHAERQRTDALVPSSLSSSIPASRLSSDPTPPPPPPPPPLPLTGFGGLSRTSREVLADDETLRIRPLTFKRPLTDWGFTNSHALTGATEAAVTGQTGGVTVKSTGSDASSSGIESNGGRSDESTQRARENGGNVPVGSSVITNYAYCGNGGVSRGIIIDVDDYRDRTCTSPSDFVFGKNYGELDPKRTTMTMLRPVTPTDDTADRKQRQRSRKTQAKHRARSTAHVGRLDTSRGSGLLSRPWKRLFGVSTDVSLPR